MMKPKSLKLITLALSGFLIATANSSTDTPNNIQLISKTNGYTRIVVDTNYEQKHPLQTVVTMELPYTIVNVGQALNYVLERSGYKLKDLALTDKATLELYTLEIPLVHREFYEATISQIVEVLVGQAFDVKINHTKRELTIAASNIEKPSQG